MSEHNASSSARAAGRGIAFPLLALMLLPLPALAQQASHGVAMSRGAFGQSGGEAVYREICAACHMPKGEGAVGAGLYPKLAANPNLEAAGYPLTVIMMGLRGMPPIGRQMNDQQVADVVNYIRTQFGNSYTADPITAADVAGLRP